MTNAEQAAIAEDLARCFHETYELLAPSFGYETRKESAKPWEEVPDKNKRLMIAVCETLLDFWHPHRINADEYECLKINFEKAFPGEALRDPQDAIQKMGATLLRARSVFDETIAKYDDSLRTSPGINPAWIDDTGFRAFAVETLRKVLEAR